MYLSPPRQEPSVTCTETVFAPPSPPQPLFPAASCFVRHSTTYRAETTLNYGMERVWALAASPDNNKVRGGGWGGRGLGLRLGLGCCATTKMLGEASSATSDSARVFDDLVFFFLFLFFVFLFCFFFIFCYIISGSVLVLEGYPLA